MTALRRYYQGFRLLRKRMTKSTKPRVDGKTVAPLRQMALAARQ